MIRALPQPEAFLGARRTRRGEHLLIQSLYDTSTYARSRQRTVPVLDSGCTPSTRTVDMDSRVAAVATIIAVVLALGYHRWSKRKTINVPQCSVPEILHALAHGDKTVRALAGRALRSIIFGEVDVLEDLLDDVAGKHSDDFGKTREDGRTLLDIAVEDAANGDADAVSLLLAITELDEAWDVDEDEWNLLVQRCRGEVKKAARGRLQARPPEGSVGLACLVARLDAPAAKIATPNGFRAEDDTLVPEPLSFNTRARCAVCGVGCSERRCARCRNVTYCCDAHRDADAARHSYWCR